ncbi:MAG: FAD-binding oxidoreductase [Rhizobiales bacterium]|nr:FAD-binding oxidoreductase [Hyphomicrobiales bacterium]
MSESYDVVIAGGAAMGSSLAFHLAADAGFKGRVLVVEKDLTYAKAASALSASSIRQQFSTAINILVSMHGIDFLRRGREILAVDGDAPDLTVREGGYLYLATEAGAHVLRENNALQRELGADIALMTPAELGARFPYLNVEDLALGSLGLSGEGWFDGYSLTQAFRRKARSLGAIYREAAVTGVEREGRRIVAVTLDDGARVPCGAFINCAGASGARWIAQMCGFDIPIESRKRSVFQFACPSPVPNLPLMIDVSGVWVRPEGEGFIGAGVPDEDPHTDDFDVDWSQFEAQLWPALAHRIPAFERIRPGRAWAGHYDLNLFDHNAIVGRMPGLDNAYLAAGFSGHGIQQSPAVGRGLAELIAHGGYRALDLSDFAFERIAAGRKILEKNVI